VILVGHNVAFGIVVFLACGYYYCCCVVVVVIVVIIQDFLLLADGLIYTMEEDKWASRAENVGVFGLFLIFSIHYFKCGVLNTNIGLASSSYFLIA